VTIKIQVDKNLQKFVSNNYEIAVGGKTVGECLDDLIQQFPEIKTRIFDNHGILMVLVVVNREMICQESLSRPVSEADDVNIAYIVGGG
jgi:molybdopterin converting factor small subunit